MDGCWLLSSDLLNPEDLYVLKLTNVIIAKNLHIQKLKII